MTAHRATPWRRRALALDRLARRDLRGPGLSADARIAWLDEALRLARESGTLREPDPADPAVLRHRRRVSRALAVLPG